MCEMILLCGFNLHFPDDWKCQAFFYIPIAICMSSLGKCLFKPLANFLIELLGFKFVEFFFPLSYRSSLLCLEINTLYNLC